MKLFRKKRKKELRSSVGVLNDNTPFAVQEAYKSLCLDIIFSLPGKNASCIGVTSANREEGKSTTAINTAISYGRMGKRTILIDCDLRLSTIASKMEIENKTPGLTDYLVGEAELSEVLRTSAKGGITVIPAGKIPPDPTRLLHSEQMHELILELKKRFDYIILDFPPVDVVTDAIVPADDVDGYLLVIRHDRSDSKDVNQMLKRCVHVQDKILGAVYNGAPVENKKYYGQSYS